MAEFLKDKPSSRVLRPPGGATSNIFGGAEEQNESNRAVKPTFQSSIFNAKPEPAQTNSKNRPSVTSSSIFASDSENKNQNSPKKVSKTHQSSIFSESDTNNASKPARKRISNIPMFTQTGPEELRRPVRRPITAPSGISACFSSQSSLDARTPVGQRKKVLADASRTRYDPITGTVIGRPSSSTSETSNASDKNPTTANGNSANNGQVTDATNQEGNAPRLGPVKNESGIRCAQPPGGKSTFSLY